MTKLIFTLAFLLLMTSPIPMHPEQAAVIFSEPEVVYQFGRQVTFSVQIESPDPILHVYLLIEVQAEEEQQFEMDVSKGENEFRFVFNTANIPLQPFSDIRYRFEVVNMDGTEATSEPFFFRYEDNRFHWNAFEKTGIRVYWQSQDEELGKTIHTIATKGLASAQRNFPQNPNVELLKIYVYSSASDLQSALGNNRPAWVGGHTLVENGTILVAIQSPGDPTASLERDIPHEIAHLLEYEILGKEIHQAPTWLLEGIATLSELNPNPEYQVALEKAKDDGSLQPISSLCNGFPPEGSAAFLSYAQSYSFTRFLRNKYGSSGLGNLLHTYGDGVRCGEGVNTVFGTTLVQLENEWKLEELGISSQKQAFSNLSPYLLLFAGFFVLIITPLIPIFLKK